jgi:hypothetical protein
MTTVTTRGPSEVDINRQRADERDRRRDRRNRVAVLWRAGHSERYIADSLKAEGFEFASKTTVGNDLAWWREEDTRRGLRAHSEQVRDENAKLDLLEVLLWRRVEADADIQAANVLMRLFERRARLNGLDLPKRVETSVEVTEVQAQLRERFLIVLGLQADPDVFDALPLPSEMAPPVRDDSALRAAIAQFDDEEDPDDEEHRDGEDYDLDEDRFDEREDPDLR